MPRFGSPEEFDQVRNRRFHIPLRNFLTGCVSGLFLCSQPSRAEDALGQLNALADQRDFASAYTLGQKLMGEYGGVENFDFLYGWSAVETGHAEEAVFALERVLLRNPQHQRARLELARAYFQLDDLNAAKQAFATVQESNPPPNVQQRIKQFLQLIDEKLEARKTRRSAAAEFSVGYDNNINSATAQTSIDVPALGQVTLDDTSLQVGDQFAELAVLGNIERSLTQQTAIGAAVDAMMHNNISSATFDYAAAGLKAYVITPWAGGNVRLPLYVQQLNVEHNPYRRLLSTGLDWTGDGSERGVPSAFLQLGETRFTDQSNKDARLWSLGLGYLLRSSDGHLSTTANGYYSNESTKEAIGKHYGRNYGGVSFASTYSFSGSLALTGSAGAQHVIYAAADPVFDQTRREKNYDIAVSVTGRWTAALSWRVEMKRSDVDANLALYDYRRNVSTVSVSYEF